MSKLIVSPIATLKVLEFNTWNKIIFGSVFALKSVSAFPGPKSVLNIKICHMMIAR